jgi:hypothetical protein
MQLPDAPDAVAPDGSDVRILLQLGRGSMVTSQAHGPRIPEVNRSPAQAGWDT